ncbi:MAG: NAD-dependent protein deacylase [Ignavibacteria bacterium GWA2_55_11]|nr:MAG: NAD-dependent protein deacylase [Ignavibacteria bacterium GWA2_55_11]OGU47341.1 MAG: NAD-dependent protein deacylase [Ignavibacteria bacterium GWC2_56_12]OGU74009.1 MAG: NAD-dependent protein deacylase [Ignavibacteria bacterium RIFCSPLOWO2_02_FULL_55_14]OGU75526.1 MAG: NAD-dependent protein deacylase [Ignavibacteria bacterium RIFCSPLOWO2_12_FULL_56_21]HAV22470.1 NAD-dependent protein deacylase [Bacteroidota bacterium]
MSVPDDLRRMAPRITSVCVLTGAGVSAESGVPTFRGQEGLWKKFSPEELANIHAFVRNPGLVWEWYAYRRKLLEEVRPNAAHVALAELERIIGDFLLVTQNVDGLHREAGSKKVVELHGNIRRTLCLECRKEPAREIELDGETVPTCEFCGGLLRPGVVWFGEQLPMDEFAAAQQAASRCQLFLSVGTSAVVQPAASLPLVARDHGAYVLEINPEPTEVTRFADGVMRVRATEGVPALVHLFASPA